jgi:6-phosphogluconate dehydrogenase
MRGGHACVVHDRTPQPVDALAAEGATGSTSLVEFVRHLRAPRAVCLMIPAAGVGATIDELAPLLDAGDTIIDGGNSHYHDDIARAKMLASKGLHFVDMGTSGGVWGIERGYCLMIGGETEIVRRLDPIFATLAPGPGTLQRTPGREAIGGTAERGYLHCGPSGAGHFVKMVHNGIEYGLMAAYAEGLNILKKANVGKSAHDTDAETTPLRHPEHYQYDFNLADISELWRRGSVVASWLLDLTAASLAQDPGLDRFGGRVSDSGEGRWTLSAANDEAVPAYVLTAALFARFASRGEDDFQNRVLSAMRFAFGGHLEKK